MPTPEARLATILDHATAADPTGVLLYFHTPAEAEAFLAGYTRFAAQREAEPRPYQKEARRIAAEVIGKWEDERGDGPICELDLDWLELAFSHALERGAPPQTGGGTTIVSDEEFERIKEVLDNPAPPTEAIIRGAETLRRLPTPPENMPPQTGGGPAPDNELLHMTEHNVAVAAAAYCRSRNSLGRHDSELLHILEDTLAERDRVAQQPIEPQTGSGDAPGERARAVVEKWFGRPGGYDHPMLPDVAAALQSEREAATAALQRVADGLGVDGVSDDGESVFVDGPGDREVAKYVEHIKETAHREGAEAMREACAKYAENQYHMNSFHIAIGIRALPIPGSKTDAG